MLCPMTTGGADSAAAERLAKEPPRAIATAPATARDLAVYLFYRLAQSARRQAIKKRSYIRFADELPRAPNYIRPATLQFAVNIWQRFQMPARGLPAYLHKPASSVVSGYDFPGC